MRVRMGFYMCCVLCVLHNFFIIMWFKVMCLPLELNFFFTRKWRILVNAENSQLEKRKERTKINDEPTKNECQKGKYVKFAGNFTIWGVRLSLLLSVSLSGLRLQNSVTRKNGWLKMELNGSDEAYHRGLFAFNMIINLGTVFFPRFSQHRTGKWKYD